MTTYKKDLQNSISYWKLRQLKAQTEKLELENAERRRELIRVDEIVSLLSEISNQLKTRLLALPRSVAIQIENVSAAEAEKILDSEIRAILRDAQQALDQYVLSLVDSEERENAQIFSGEDKASDQSEG